jgi:hemolysin D
VQSTIEKLKETIPLAKTRMDIRTTLAKKELGSKLHALAAQQEYVEQKRELQTQQERLAEAREAIASLKEQRRQAEMEFRRTMLTDLSTAEQKIASLDEQLVQAGQRLKLQTLRAPVDGTVQELSVHTEGGVVTPAQALLVIVPKDTPLEVDAFIPNRDIGFVSVGQVAEVKIDTFNFTKYGLLSGRVEAISQDAVTRSSPAAGHLRTGAENESSEPKGQELVYNARIKLDQTYILVDGKEVGITPGMAVTAEVKTGQRRIIEYLLSPLARHSQQALRER